MVWSGIQFKDLTMGFPKHDSADYERLTAFVKELHIAILTIKQYWSHGLMNWGFQEWPGIWMV